MFVAECAIFLLYNFFRFKLVFKRGFAFLIGKLLFECGIVRFFDKTEKRRVLRAVFKSP